MTDKISAGQLLELMEQYPVLDVRSPGEYAHAHIPGAYSLPLFTDEERKVVGTLYKQEGKQPAIKQGLNYFGVKMRSMVEEAEKIAAGHGSDNTVLVHCWRGGMRSAGVSWLLALYGFKVYTLAGGYKAFRHMLLQQFEKPYPFRVLGGYTGSGKTMVLQELARRGAAIIDLEALAAHKGSAFGGFDGPQPSQEMFENLLAMELLNISKKPEAQQCIWLEDESRRIGNVNLPGNFWETKQAAPMYFFDIPFEQRLDNIVATYGQYTQEELLGATMRIQKRLGGLQSKNATSRLQENNFKEAFRILLAYYDKFYSKGLAEHLVHDGHLEMIPCTGVDAIDNCSRLLDKKRIENG